MEALPPCPHKGGFAPFEPPLRAEPLEPFRVKKGGRLSLCKIPERPPFLTLKNGFQRLAFGEGPGSTAPWWGGGGKAPILAPSALWCMVFAIECEQWGVECRAAVAEDAPTGAGMGDFVEVEGGEQGGFVGSVGFGDFGTGMVGDEG